ncbi:Pvc16 family protein [Micromonospora soli]|uniref:Pvc16 family protein n=1 Tax=Micromonospora sp. NBRC 110009 TaxID=3061627 RepID=UPI00267120FA|nr:Pvc16 family protein [Micromonospora sp. NBRC 110009]WKT96884.1 Pvc16 family protein [Micromonospora sp. NBRC 110009]
MAGYKALAAVGSSVQTLLRRGIDVVIPPGQRRPAPILIGTKDLDDLSKPGAAISYPALAIFCYRLSVDRETRPAWSAVAESDGIPRLPLCMHLLITAFDETVESELQWLGLAGSLLETTSVLSGSLLDSDGAWRDGETVQVTPEDMALESMSEAFQALTANFRLYLLYQAKVVVLEGLPGPIDGRVATVGADLRTMAGR